MLSERYYVTKDQCLAFRQNGHCLLRRVASTAEIKQYHPMIKQAATRYNTERRPLAERDTYGKAFLQIMNLWTHDEQVRAFVLARKFAQLAADLLGVERVRIYHDQALYKEPGGGPTPWHQDQYYWPLDTDKTVTMWMPLIDIEKGMGMLNFASGSHHDGPITQTAISDDSERIFEEYVKQKGYEVTDHQSMKAGDATFHAGWSIHKAGPNLSDKTTREVMTIIYFADGAKVTKPAHQNQENDRQQWLEGLAPGELAASVLNPIANRNYLSTQR